MMGKKARLSVRIERHHNPLAARSRQCLDNSIETRPGETPYR
jgi:hypothetical protein